MYTNTRIWEREFYQNKGNFNVSQEYLKDKTLPALFSLRKQTNFSKLRNGPDKNDSNNGNEHVGMQKKVLTFLLSVLNSDWPKDKKLTKLHKAVHIFILTFQPSSI